MIPALLVIPALLIDRRNVVISCWHELYSEMNSIVNRNFGLFCIPHPVTPREGPQAGRDGDAKLRFSGTGKDERAEWRTYPSAFAENVPDCHRRR